MARRTTHHARTTVRAVTAALLATAATAVALPAQAHGRAQAPACGITVTADYTLPANLRCSGTAITVVPSNPAQTITLDLGGHAVVGDGTGVGVDVRVDETVGGSVVVRNGQIRGFDAAVAGSNVAAVTLADLTVRNNRVWFAQGVLEMLAFRLTVDHARVVDSGTAGGPIESYLTVRSSQFVRSSVEQPSESYATVQDSVFVGGGVTTGYAANVVAERNTFRNCDIGVHAYDSWPSSPTTVQGNHFVGCRIGALIEVSTAGVGPNAVTVTGNEFRRNAEAGLTFRVWDPIGQIDITGNVAIDNGGAGITGTGAGITTVAHNTAVRNHGRGIDVADAVDGGGNVARGNTTSPQCVGVVCAARP